MITRLRSRGVTYEEADEVAKTLGLSYSVAREDTENETIVHHRYHIDSPLISPDNNILMRYTVYDSGNNFISIAGPIGFLRETHYILMRQKETMFASFTTKQQLEHILTHYIQKIDDMERESACDSINCAQSELRDVLSHANS